jgi:hypothetical protein
MSILQVDTIRSQSTANTLTIGTSTDTVVFTGG